MNKQLLSAAGLFLCLAGTSAFAQRYQTEVFTDTQIQTTSDIEYGRNIQILTGAPVEIGLLMDVYQPDQAIDNVNQRPLVILLHTGNFLPKIGNQSATGSRKDSSIVASARAFAKRGYVAAAISYRLGWNPVAPDQETRVKTLIQAVYRSILDTKTAVRFFKKDQANANAYGIDSTKIALYGHGTGGYVAINYAVLNKNSEMEIAKFVDGSNVPFINRAQLGELDGSGGIPQLNIYNHPGHTNDISMVINAGGAMGDISWLEAGEVPMVSIHCIRDPFAPFNVGTVFVPGATPLPVVEVQGANNFILQANALGNNDAFVNTSFFGDPYTARARELYNRTYPYIYPSPNDQVTIGNAEGLLAFDLPDRSTNPNGGIFANQGSPWDWWNPQILEQEVAGYNSFTGSNIDWTLIHGSGLLSNPDMSYTKAMKYIDSIQGYINPRMMRVMQIGNWEALSVNENVSNNKLNVYPNPANGNVNITLGNVSMNNIQIFDISGKLVKSVNNAGNIFSFNTSELNNGLYLVRVQTENSVEISRLIVK